MKCTAYAAIFRNCMPICRLCAAWAYRQAWDYLEGETNYDTFVEKGIVATRQLAKRQLTWLRKIPLAHTLDPYADSDYVQTALALARQHFQE